ncbi:MAG: ABC transporter permease [Anaerolineae bacterium]|nr:MAG: ABC transporter permease [Anaerolineae bacterium]
MNLRRILSLAWKDTLHLRHDWWLPAFMLLGGAMELLLIGWATSRPVTNLPLMVLDGDQSRASRTFVSAVMNTGTFVLEDYVRDEVAIREALARGTIYAAVIIPPGYAEQIIRGESTIAVLLNGAESIPATEALRAIEGVSSELGLAIMLERMGLDPQDVEGFLPSLRVWFNESLSEAYYTTPAELGLMMEFTVLLFAALSFSRERELGTLEQLLVMPYSRLELIVGKSIPVIAIGFIDFLLMLGVVHFFFDVPIRGSLFLLLILALGYILVELGKGMVISVVSRTQHQAFLLVLLVGMVDFMFTGYAAPVESMPAILQYLANIVPAQHWLEIVRGIMLKASDLRVLWPQIVALIVLGLFIGTFSFRYVRRALY